MNTLNIVHSHSMSLTSLRMHKRLFPDVMIDDLTDGSTTKTFVCVFQVCLAALQTTWSNSSQGGDLLTGLHLTSPKSPEHMVADMRTSPELNWFCPAKTSPAFLHSSYDLLMLRPADSFGHLYPGLPLCALFGHPVLHSLQPGPWSPSAWMQVEPSTARTLCLWT